jgi:hypothetical protein
MKKVFAILGASLALVGAAFASTQSDNPTFNGGIEAVALKNFHNQNWRAGFAFPVREVPFYGLRVSALALTDSKPFSDTFRLAGNGSSIQNLYLGVGVSKRVWEEGNWSMSGMVGYTTDVRSLKNPQNGSFGFGVSVGVRF